MASFVRAAQQALSATPSRSARLLVALIAGAYGGLIVHSQYNGHPGFHTDFGMLWYGAGALLDHRDPYALIGPGRAFDYRWPLIYPAAALVPIIPLSFLTEHAAAVVFVALSSAALAYAVTGKGWYLIVLFITDSFITAAKLGQFTILLTAALFLPMLAFFAVAKPQSSLPVLAGTTDRKTILYAMAGGITLVAISLLLVPDWPVSWITALKRTANMEAPIMRFGGFLVLAVLFRWRRAESWLLLTLACLPQSWGWYGALPLFTIPATLLEIVFLTSIATAGSYLGALIIPSGIGESGFFGWVGSLIVFTIYLPAVALILRRPNAGNPPAFLSPLMRQPPTARKPLESGNAYRQKVD